MKERDDFAGCEQSRQILPGRLRQRTRRMSLDDAVQALARWALCKCQFALGERTEVASAASSEDGGT